MTQPRSPGSSPPVDPRIGPAALRDATRLVVDAVVGVTDVVEAMHGTIASLAPPVGRPRERRTRGITGLVYGSIRGITRGIGLGLETSQRLLPDTPLSERGAARQDLILARLNGVIGDRLAASESALALPMQLRSEGQAMQIDREALSARFGPQPGRKLAIFVHGLCMNDRQWRGSNHDHGTELARDFGVTPLHLFYNTGQRISTNGEALAVLLDGLVKVWPGGVDSLQLIGHSMGGLVIRSALDQAREQQMDWLAKTEAAIFLGSPHHGAPLERLGNAIDLALRISPYSAPLARLGGLRSAGIRDLRHGNVHASDWAGVPTRHWRDPRQTRPLPEGPRYLAIAGSTSSEDDSPTGRLKGDGLVPVASALGQHADPERRLKLADRDRHIVPGTNHLELLHSRRVYRILRDWLRGR